MNKVDILDEIVEEGLSVPKEKIKDDPEQSESNKNLKPLAHSKT